MSKQDSVWQPIVSAWLLKETTIHPELGIDEESVTVRDVVEIKDDTFVLVSYTVSHPWPAEEEAAGSDLEHTAVIQARRITEPWQEKDSTYSLKRLQTTSGSACLDEYLLGQTRMISGMLAADSDASEVTIVTEDGETLTAPVVSDWFFTRVGTRSPITKVAVGAGEGEYVQESTVEMDLTSEFSAIRAYEDEGYQENELYFQPGDVRHVTALMQWVKRGTVSVIAVSLEEYTDGGILRLRLSGIIPDDDAGLWPQVDVRIGDDRVLAETAISAVYGDTMALDIAFSPFADASSQEIVTTLTGIRSLEGPLDEVKLIIEPRESRSQAE